MEAVDDGEDGGNGVMEGVADSTLAVIGVGRIVGEVRIEVEVEVDVTVVFVSDATGIRGTPGQTRA